MRKPEQEMWDKAVRPALESIPQLVYARHECRVSPGTADLDYAYEGGGWIEMKRVKAPRRENGRLPIRHLTKQQVGFLRLRGDCGQGAWVIVQVDEMVEGKERKMFYLWGHWNLEMLEAPGIRYVLWPLRCLRTWAGKIDAYDMVQVMAAHTRGNRASAGARLKSPKQKEKEKEERIKRREKEREMLEWVKKEMGGKDGQSEGS